jgi:uncharacterized Zn-finger protein
MFVESSIVETSSPEDAVGGGDRKKSQIFNWLIDQPNVAHPRCPASWSIRNNSNRSSSKLNLYSPSISSAAISLPVSQISRQRAVNSSLKSPKKGRNNNVDRSVSFFPNLASSLNSSISLSSYQPAQESSCSVDESTRTSQDISSWNLAATDQVPVNEFRCRLCSKSYSTIGATRLHWRTHTLPCRCTVCGKAFSRPWLLRGHTRTHTGERPFQCPNERCRRSFADRSNLRAHLQTHVDVKKYACGWCPKTFSRVSLLAKHKRTCC